MESKVCMYVGVQIYLFFLWENVLFWKILLRKRWPDITNKLVDSFMIKWWNGPSQIPAYMASVGAELESRVARWFCFQTKNPNFGKVWRVFQWKIYIGIFYDHLVYFTAIGNILWPFGMFCSHLVYFPRFGIIYIRKIWQPCSIAMQEWGLCLIFYSP
jgi:hypothetical protein